MAFSLTTPIRLNHLSLYQNREREILSYRQFGDSDRCVILIHGWMSSGTVYDTMLKEGLFGTYRVIVPNLRGSGIDGLDGGPVSIDQFGRDIIDLVNYLELDKFHIVGHDMGGQVAQWLASELPTRVMSLSLLCSMPASGLRVISEAEDCFREIGGKLETITEMIEAFSPDLPPAEHDRLIREAYRLKASAIAHAFDAWSTASFENQLYRITSPTMVVITGDPAIPENIQRKSVAAKIPHARIQVLSDCGHYPQCERPNATAAMLRRFWNQSTPIPFQLPR